MRVKKNYDWTTSLNSFFSFLFDFGFLTGYERKVFKATRVEQRHGNGPHFYS